jgi:hypothetical protein
VYDSSSEYVGSTPLVLRALMEEPFVPMDRASLKYVTLKTVFLVASATAQRRSELHALSYEKISFNKERGRSNWHPCQAFWRRTRRLTPLGLRLLSLSCRQRQTIPDRTLCPLQALMFYVDRTRPPTVRRGRQHCSYHTQ